jgi:hypothetical protein
MRRVVGVVLGKSLTITVYFLSPKYPFYGHQIKLDRACIPTLKRSDHCQRLSGMFHIPQDHAAEVHICDFHHMIMMQYVPNAVVFSLSGSMHPQAELEESIHIRGLANIWVQ